MRIKEQLNRLSWNLKGKSEKLRLKDMIRPPASRKSSFTIAVFRITHLQFCSGKAAKVYTIACYTYNTKCSSKYKNNNMIFM